MTQGRKTDDRSTPKGLLTCGVLTRFGWGILDQTVSSATNSLGSIFAARALGLRDFGIWALGFSLYLIVLGLSRAWSCEPMIIRFSAQATTSQNLGIRYSMSNSLAIGAGAGVLIAAAGLLLDPEFRNAFLILALCLPSLVLQDAQRLALIMKSRQRAASINDGVWLTVVMVVMGLFPKVTDSPASATFFWSLGSVFACLIGFIQLRLLPSSWRLKQFTSLRSLGLPISLEFLMVSGVTYMLTVGLAIFKSVDESAGLRGAQVVMGPLNILALGIGMQALPHLVRDAENGTRDLERNAALISCLLGVTAVVWGIVLVLIPDELGERLLGDTWSASSPLIPILTFTFFIAGITSGALHGIKALGSTKASLSIRLAMSPIALASGLVGGCLEGARGVIIGLGAANSLAMPFWWLQFRRSMRNHLEAEVETPGSRV